MLAFDAISENPLGVSSAGDTLFEVTGVQGTTALGTAGLITDNFISVTGFQGTTALGSVTTFNGTGVVFSVSGVLGTTYLGTSTQSGAASIYPTGLAATGQIGTVDAFGLTNVNPTGVYGTGYIGDAETVISQFLNVSGVYATGIVGLYGVWTTIDDSQTPSWIPISSISSSNWDTIPTSGNG
jgi:hypothetical protein